MEVWSYDPNSSWSLHKIPVKSTLYIFGLLDLALWHYLLNRLVPRVAWKLYQLVGFQIWSTLWSLYAGESHYPAARIAERLLCKRKLLISASLQDNPVFALRYTSSRHRWSIRQFQDDGFVIPVDETFNTAWYHRMLKFSIPRSVWHYLASHASSSIHPLWQIAYPFLTQNI